MDPEEEKQLKSTNEKQKKRIQELEELFASQDEEYHQRLKELMEQKKELTAKNNNLETRMYTISEENAELAKTLESLTNSSEKDNPQQPAEPQTNFMSESFVNEYTDLQDKVDELNEDKIALQSKIRELENHIQKLIHKTENLESMNIELSDALSDVNKEKKKLAQENKNLAECVTMLQMQVDTLGAPEVDQKERGNSLFGEVDEARKNAEEELKKVVEQNVFLNSEIDALQIRLRRYAHATLTHADQVEIEFQKKHSEQIFAQLQEYMKDNERYAQQIDDLNKKLAAIETMPPSCKEKENFTLVITKRQLDMANSEMQKLRKIVDEQNIQLHELGVKALEIPGLKASIKRYENKVASFEEEVKMLKELNNVNNKAMLSKPNDENVAPRLDLREVPTTPQAAPRPRPRLISPSKTQPVKAPATSWADKLKSQYKHIAREQPIRERSLDFRRASRMNSMTRNPEV